MLFQNQIRAYAQGLGFQAIGFAHAEPLTSEAVQLKHWLGQKKHGTMSWMQKTVELRTNPLKLLPEAKTIIVVLMNYFPGNNHVFLTPPRISRYAWGRDYHYVIRAKLHQLHTYIQDLTGSSFSAKIAVDSVPFMDKVWAVKAGLGWIGKNSLLLNPRNGSYFFIGALLIDFAFEPDAAFRGNFCGTCTRCIDACPTQAITPFSVDASRCISYLTIEYKDETPAEIAAHLNGWAFGCDICQEVCPWNKFASINQVADFEPLSILMTIRDSANAGQLTKSQFQKQASLSPISRVRLPKWIANLNQAQKYPGCG